MQMQELGRRRCGTLWGLAGEPGGARRTAVVPRSGLREGRPVSATSLGFEQCIEYVVYCEEK